MFYFLLLFFTFKVILACLKFLESKVFGAVSFAPSPCILNNLSSLCCNFEFCITEICLLFISSFQAFFNDDYLAKNPGHASFMDELKELIVDQVKNRNF